MAVAPFCYLESWFTSVYSDWAMVGGDNSHNLDHWSSTVVVSGISSSELDSAQLSIAKTFILLSSLCSCLNQFCATLPGLKNAYNLMGTPASFGWFHRWYFWWGWWSWKLTVWWNGIFSTNSKGEKLTTLYQQNIISSNIFKRQFNSLNMFNINRSYSSKLVVATTQNFSKRLKII
jgi:hypothetical protein